MKQSSRLKKAIIDLYSAELIPDNVNYQNPFIGLKNLKKYGR